MRSTGLSLRLSSVWFLLIASIFTLWGNDEFTTAPTTPPTFRVGELHARADSGSVLLSWQNGAAYDRLEIWLNEERRAILSGSDTEYRDSKPGAGMLRYQVLPTHDGVPLPATSVEIIFSGNGTDLIWVPGATLPGATDSGWQLASDMSRLGRRPVWVDELPSAAELLQFDSVWVTLGTAPYNHILTAEEADRLSRYIDARADAALYLEGGNTWFDDPETSIHGRFALVATASGDDQLGLQWSTGAACLTASDIDYEGERNSIDRLQATAGGMALLRNVNPEYDTVVLTELPNGARMVGASHEFAGLRPSQESRAQTLRRYFECFGLPTSEPTLPAAATSANGNPLPTVTVQSGTTTSSGNGITTVNITAVNPTRAFLIFQSRHSSARPVGSMIKGSLASATTLEFERATNETSTMDIQWYVVEYSSGLSVQRGDTPGNNGTIGVAPVAATSQAFVTWSKHCTSTDQTWDFNDPILFDLIATDQIQLRVDTSASTHSAHWQLIEFTDSSLVNVQRGNTSMGSGTASVNVTLPTTVDPTRSFALVGFRQSAGGNANIGRRIVRARLLNGNTLNIDRGQTGTAITEISWQVIELFDGSVVQHGSTNFTTGDASQTETLSAVNLATSTPFSPSQPAGGQNQGRTPYNANDIVGVGSATLELTSSTQLTLDRTSTVASADIGWQVVDWGPRAPVISSLTPTSGSSLGGDTITITGDNLRSTSAVTFDGIAATSITSIGDTTVTCVTPAHAAGLVNVVVTNPTGSTTLSGAYTYVAAPVLTSVAPNNGTPLGGETVTLTGTDFDAATQASFDGIGATTTFVNSTTLTAVTPAHAAGSVDVTVTNANGSDTLTNAFTYNNPPTLTSLTPTSGTPLGGDLITLSGSDFTSSTTVTIDGIAASTTFVNTTTLTATTPAHAPGSVNVSVSNANGSDTLASAFTYDNPPTLTSLSPTSGTPLGGTVVSLVGSDFTSGTTVTFDGLAAATTFNSTTSLSVTTPAHAAGSVDVTVTNANGTDTLSNSYTYDTPPQLTLVAPNSGTPLGGTSVTLTGSNFTPGTSVTFGATSATSVSFVSATTLNATTPAGTPGSVNVSVSNVNGSSTLTSAYTYDTPPTLNSLAPAEGTPLGGDTITLTGANFTAGSVVEFDGIAAASSFVSSTTLTATTPSHAPGVVSVTVSNANGITTLSNSFTYLNAPDVAAVSPNSGSPVGGTAVTLTGSDFTPATSVDFGGNAATAVTFVNSTTLTANTPAGTPGAVNVTVSNANGSNTLTNAFTYDTPPTLTAVSPNSGSPLGGTTVTVTGTDLTATTGVTFDGAAAAVTFVNATTLTVTTPAGTPGDVDVAINNVNGSDTLIGAFTYDSPPTLVSLGRVAGSPLGGESIVISAVNITPDVEVFFDGLPALVTFTDLKTIIVTTPAHPPGLVDVTISNLNGSDTLSNAFTYSNPPLLSAIAPTAGTPLGGDSVTLTGSDFNGTETVTFGGNAGIVTFVSSTTLTVVTPALAPGAQDVTVSNANGSSTLNAAFLVNNPPLLTSIAPTSGSPLGGEVVTLTGSEFTAGSTVSFGATAATVSFVSSTTLSVTTPALSAGASDVTVANVNGSSTLTAAYVVNAAPQLTSIAPTSGSPLGGDTITLNGSGFTPSDSVTFGATAVPVTFVDANTATVVTPPLPSGATDVTLSNSNGSSTLTAAFLVNDPPLLASINPVSGSPLGGESVTLNGSGFTAADSVFFNATAAAVTFVDANTLTVITPALAAGATDVTVNNANGTSTLSGAYLVNSPPVATAINPTSGSPLGGETVTISGSNFTATDTVTFAGVAAAVTFVDSSTLSAVTPPLAAGAADVTVSNVNGSSTLSGAFLVNGAPTLTSIAPTSGSPLGGDSVTLTGSGFTPADSVTFGGISGAVTFVSSTTLTVVTPALPSGAVDVTVSNVNGSATLVAAFLVNDPPLLASINPVSGSPLGGESVTLNGSGFTAADSVFFNATAAAVTFVDANTLTVITPALAAGATDVTVNNANGTSTLSGAYLVNSPPVATAINPTSGSPLGGETVTISGSNFTATDTVTFAGVAAAVTFVDSSTLSAVTPPLAAGAADVTVSNVNGSSTLSGAFLVNGAPTLTSIAPTSGSPLGGDSVTLTGSGFTPADSVTFGGISGAVTFVSSTTLTVVTPALPSGAVDVTVSNVNGSATLVAAFLVNDPPLLASINPSLVHRWEVKVSPSTVQASQRPIASSSTPLPLQSPSSTPTP